MPLLVCAVLAILKECKACAQAVGQQDKDVDGKVCRKKVPWRGYYSSTHTEKPGDWSCVDYAKKGVNPAGHEVTKLSSRFRDASGGDVKRDDIDSTGAGAKHNRGWPGTAEGKINTAQGMAGAFTMPLLVCAVPVILKECKAYAQAVGQQAKDIDGKVCAKKVWKAKGGNDATRDAAVEATNGRWSCVDYAVGAGQSTHNDVKDIASTHGFMWRFGDTTKDGA